MVEAILYCYMLRVYNYHGVSPGFRKEILAILPSSNSEIFVLESVRRYVIGNDIVESVCVGSTRPDARQRQRAYISEDG